ncbi:MAG: hypothetical protein U1A72_12015, partial [Sulfuritalea sp.]|nr:hypothetical protein [Sulfuritalea sp.]
MAEDKFNSNTKSPRFSTTKALGFRGGSTNAQTGNLQQPTYLQSAGINPAAPKPPTSDAGGPGISQFSAGNVPRPSLAGTLATQAGGVLAGEGMKAGFRGLKNALTPAAAPAVSDPWGAGAKPTGVGALAENPSVLSGMAGNVSDYMNSFAPYSSAAPSGVAALAEGPSVVSGMSGNVIDTVAPEATGWGAQGSFPMSDAAAGASEAAGAAAPAFGGGPAYAAANMIVQNDLIPKAVETAGNFMDSIVPDCFITEAVMATGGADNGMELEALRGFRDNILSATPQGQAMIGEYDAIAPIVV